MSAIKQQVLSRLNGFRRSEFASNAAMLSLGTGIAQVLPLIFYPILTRIFSPAQFGELATITSVVSILAVLFSGQYRQAVLITKSKEEAVNIVGLILLLSLGLMLVSYLALFGYNMAVGAKGESGQMAKLLYVCPVAAAAVTVFDCYNEWCVKFKLYKSLSWNKVFNSGFVSVGKLLAGLLGFLQTGLVFGDLIGRILSAGGCIGRALKSDRAAFRQMSWSGIKYVAARFSDFPKYTLPSQLLNTVSVALPILLLGAYYSKEEVGYFSMAMTLLALPVNVISFSLRDVFRQKANEVYVATGNCRTLFLRMLRTVALGSVAVGFVVVWFLPLLFAVVLGHEWRMSGVYSQIMLPMMVFDFVAMSVSGVMIITEKVRQLLWWQIYMLSVTVIALVGSYYLFNDILISLIALSVGKMSAYAFYVKLNYKYSKGNTEE